MHRTEFAPHRLLLRAALATSLLAAPWTAAWAVVKCVAPDGHVTFQDVGCNVHSSTQPLLQRFGQLSSEAATPRTPRVQRDAPPQARNGGRQASASAPAGLTLGQVPTPAWR